MKSAWWIVTAKRQMQQSGSVDLDATRVFLPAAVAIAEACVGNAMALSCLSALVLQMQRRVYKLRHLYDVCRGLRQKTYLNGLVCACHSRPISILILTHL